MVCEFEFLMGLVLWRLAVNACLLCPSVVSISFLILGQWAGLNFRGLLMSALYLSVTGIGCSWWLPTMQKYDTFLFKASNISCASENGLLFCITTPWLPSLSINFTHLCWMSLITVHPMTVIFTIKVAWVFQFALTCWSTHTFHYTIQWSLYFWHL